MSQAMKISASKLVDYYYGKDPVFGKENGDACSWVGSGAEKMGLTGKVDFEQLVNLASGMDKDGEKRLVGKATGEQAHHLNASTDILLTIPKSVSIVALNDEKLQREIVATFTKTAEFAERFVKGRQTVDGVTSEVVGKMIGMLAIHSTNRNDDPHLHAHLNILNETERPDGTFSTVENKELFKNLALIQQYQYNAVAKVLTDNGFAIELTKSKQGLIIPEVSGIPKDLIELYSSRQSDIKGATDLKLALQERMPGLNERQIDNLIQLQTKAEKNGDLSEKDLRAGWELKELTAGFNVKELIEASRTGIQAEKMTAKEHVSLAISDLNENESIFSQKDVLLNAMKMAVGQCDGDEIEKAMLTAIKSGEMVKHGDGYTTPEMIKLEHGVIQKAVDQREQFTPLRTEEQSAKAIQDFQDKEGWTEKGWSVSKGQDDAIEMVLTTQNRLSIIQGDAGAGKSTAFKIIRDTLQDDKDLTIVGLSFQGKAAASLQQSSGIQSQTVDSFLQKKIKPEDIEKAQNGHRQLWVVDEASMLGSRHLSALMEKAETLNAQIILVGDTKQIASIQAGRLMADLIDTKAVDTSIMAEVKRQQTAYTIEIANELKQGNISGAFKILEDHNRIHEISDRQELVKTAATAYVETQTRIKAEHAESGKPINIGQDMVLMAPTNQLRKEVISEVREMQKTAGHIQAENITVTTREPISLVGGLKRLAENYETGNIITLSKNAGIFAKSSELVIAGVDLATNSIKIDMGNSKNLVSNTEENAEMIKELKDSGGIVSIDLRKFGHCFSQSAEVESTFSIGERVAWLKNDGTHDGKRLGIKTGIVADITGYDPETKNFTLMQENGKEVTKDLTNLFITNAQCLTPNKAQGLSSEDGKLVTDPNTDAPLLNMKSMYSALTRMEKDLEIFTTDKAVLLELASQNTEKTSTVNVSELVNAEKTSVMEFLQNSYETLSAKLSDIISTIDDKFNSLVFNEPETPEIKQSLLGEATPEKSAELVNEQSADKTQGQETGTELDKGKESIAEVALDNDKGLENDHDDDHDEPEQERKQSYEMSM